MKMLFSAFVTSALLAGAAPAFAQSAFDGTWKGEVSSMKVDAKPDTFAIKGGSYSCSTCIPAYTVKADGTFHAVKGKDYWDDIAVTVVDPAHVRYQYRKGGKVIATTDQSVSADGKTLTNTSSNTNNAAGTLIEATATTTRAAPAPAGAHAVSGSWVAAPASAVSDAGITITLKVEGDTLNLTSPMGETLAAKFGGPAALNVGDPGKTMTKAELLAPNAMKLTDMRAGKVVGITTYTVAADGATLAGAWSDPRDGSKGTFTATKQ